MTDVDLLDKLGFVVEEITPGSLFSWVVEHPKYEFCEVYKELVLQTVIDDFAYNAYKAGEDSMSPRW